MGKDTNIEWCDSTINGTSGCDGCELWNAQVRTCYAGHLQTSRLSKSLPHLYSRDFSEVRMIPGRYAQAAAWSDLRGTERPEKPWLNGLPRMIFVGDLGDTFSRAITDEYLERELLGAILSKNGQRHFWMLLTKRPKRLAALAKKWGGLPDNVMAMTTVTDQNTADRRIPELLKVPGRWRGLSCEPLIGAVDLRIPQLRGAMDDPRFGGNFKDFNEAIHWVIAGGESGPGARPMHPDWARSLRDQCSAAGVPFFFKQWGEWLYPPDIGLSFDDFPKAERGQVWTSTGPTSRKGYDLVRVGKKKAGRELDGSVHDEFPRLATGDTRE